MNNLTLEKQLAHSIFCQQLQDIDIANAKQLLVELHLLYLSQQSVFIDLLGQDLPGNMN